jgi:hypothetical protein
VEKLLEDAQIKLSVVASDIFGVLLPSTDFAVDHVVHRADGRCRGAVVIMTA